MHLLNRAPRIDMVFNFFPEIMIKILRKLNRTELVERLLYKGGYLKKVVHDDHEEWVKNGNRPSDVITLLRNVTTYKLARRGNMFVRTFLSRCTEYFFLVIDCAESNMEIFSQNNSVSMEVEVGAIDLFSF